MVAGTAGRSQISTDAVKQTMTVIIILHKNLKKVNKKISSRASAPKKKGRKPAWPIENLPPTVPEAPLRTLSATALFYRDMLFVI
jgi:hypothetical protein